MRALFVLVCLLILIDVAFGCSCMPVSMRKKYCEADFVVKAKVESELVNLDGMQGFDDFYRIEILSVIKMNNDTAVDLSKIYTASNGALCGVYLAEGEIYYIGGDISRENRLSINLCQSLTIYSNPNKRKKPNIIRKPPTCW